MTIQEKHRAQNTIRAIAIQYGKTEHQVRQSIQEAIDAAWEAAWEPGNIHVQAKWQALFGAQKPSVEEFIVHCAADIQHKR